MVLLYTLAQPFDCWCGSSSVSTLWKAKILEKQILTGCNALAVYQNSSRCQQDRYRNSKELPTERAYPTTFGEKRRELKTSVVVLVSTKSKSIPLSTAL